MPSAMEFSIPFTDGFDPNGSYWTCTECGEFLTDPDMDQSGNQFEDVGWFCDSCGALLNKQSGFSDWCGYWTCTECGCENHISEDEIEDPHKEPSFLDSVNNLLDSVNNVLEAFVPEDSDDYSDDEDDDYSYGDESDDDSYNDDSSTVYENVSSGASTQSSYEYTYKRSFSDIWKDFLHKLKIFCICVLGIDFLIGAIAIWYKADSYFNGIPVGVSTSEVSKMKYEDLKKNLSDAGFKNISCTYAQDLEYNEGEKEYYVADMKIGEDSSFSKDDEYSRFSKITITYHLMKNSELPLSAKEAKGQEYQEVEKAFKEVGFGNIELIADYDVSIGWFAKEGEVEEITVDGSKKFSSGSSYGVDTPIVITYHANKKDKPE